MYIQTEATPNHNALKFLVEGMCQKGMILEFEKEGSNLEKLPFFVKKLFGIEDILRVFVTDEFVTVTKAAAASWDALKIEILEIFFEAKLNGEDIKEDLEEKIDTSNLDSISKEIINLIEERVKPAVAMDGGDITFVKFDSESGIVYVKLKGSCSGCPSSQITLQSGIKRMLQYYVPEVYEVVSV